jgi:hypothetical protein
MTPAPGSRTSGRVRIALVLIFLFAGASTARWLHDAARWPAGPLRDEISANDRRFERLRPELPAQGRVGYMGDPALGGATARDSNTAALQHFRRYLLAQYALAPVVLVKSTEPEFVVGNFDPGRVAPPPPGFRLERDFGAGLVLYRRSGP